MGDRPKPAEAEANPRGRRLLSPDRFVVGLLLAIVVLWLSDRFQWIGINHHKGWTVLIAVAAVGIAMILMLLWFAISVAFHRRFQFGIRSLLMLVVALSVAAGWLAAEMRRARRQMETVEWVENSTGWADYEWQVDEKDPSIVPQPIPEPPVLASLRGMLGEDFFSSVVAISFNRTEITDAELENLMDLSRVDWLFLSNTEVTDAWLEHLRGTTHLTRLDLNHTNVTDAGLYHLKGLTALRMLDVNHTKVTDEAVEKLQQALPNCKIYR